MKYLLMGLLLMLPALAGCGGRSDTVEYPATPPPVETPAPDATPTPAPAPDPTPEPTAGGTIHGALHRVEYGNNVAYLFGTLHAGDPSWFPLAAMVEDALQRADVVALEVESLEGMEAEFLAIVMEIITLPDGNTWADLLPPEYYAHLVAMAEAWGMVYTLVNTWHPAFFVQMITTQIPMIISDLSFDVGDTVDGYVAAVAAARGIPIIGLETIEQQTRIAFLPPHDAMLALIMQLDTPDEMVRNFIEGPQMLLDDMAYYYRQNDFANAMQEFSLLLEVDDCPWTAYFIAYVNNWRSTYYAHRIMDLLRDTDEPTTFFVAVGLSHVIRSWSGEGFTDIVAQMRLAGFTVEPLF